MTGLRTRIDKLEDRLGRTSADDEREWQVRFARQLDHLSDAELNRLEDIVTQTIEITGDTARCAAFPDGCETLTEFIAFVDQDETAYFEHVKRLAACGAVIWPVISAAA
ncbi:hypothetical protein [Mesorhizobium huakuii]|uniref:Uncharacterized protein n=1 Tax=Mesorhizobium huakuii TaxID=28104 RepID=A0A7G6STP3_9HYPH|nr:hypothetical protein [Mesorhizobium huakuii]QND57875.1 hypothetical protein HB778_15655 [Mesorhizobium huakuii]